jgi:hypothetical protein
MIHCLVFTGCIHCVCHGSFVSSGTLMTLILFLFTFILVIHVFHVSNTVPFFGLNEELNTRVGRIRPATKHRHDAALVRVARSRNHVSIPDRVKVFVSFPHVQTSREAHPASCTLNTIDSSHGGMKLSIPLPRSRVVVKNAWSYTSTPLYVFMRWCLMAHRDSFAFILYRT